MLKLSYDYKNQQDKQGFVCLKHLVQYLRNSCKIFSLLLVTCVSFPLNYTDMFVSYHCQDDLKPQTD